MGTVNRRAELLRSLKFTLFSASAGLIQIGAFALCNDVIHLPAWLGYLIALVLSVLWNFTLNRRYTFRSAASVPRAMALVALFYLVFYALHHLAGALAHRREALERLPCHGAQHGAEPRVRVPL